MLAADRVVQELRGDVRTVGPDQGLPHRVQSELLEEGSIVQRLENGAVQHGPEIDFAGRAVAAPHPDGVVELSPLPPTAATAS